MKKEISKKDILSNWKKRDDKESLLSQWKSRENTQAAQSTLSNIRKAPTDSLFTPSQGQQRLWFLQSLKPENPYYNYAESYELKGKLNNVLLKESLDLVIKEQEVLRSFYPLEEENVLYKVVNSLEIEIINFDFSNLGEDEQKTSIHSRMMNDARTSFNLQKAPLWRVSLLKLAPEMHVLLVTLHHIITDKWSMDIFRDRLAKHYVSLSKGETTMAESLTIQYGDYSYDQKNRPINKSQLNYWKGKLSADMPVLELPYDYSRPTELSFEGGHHVQEFTLAFSEEVLNFSKNIEVTPYILMLSAYYVFLNRLTDQADIAIGSPISNRNESALEKIMGFFNDTLVLRTQIDTSKSFVEILAEVRKMSFEAFENKDVPFEVLVKEINQKRSQFSNPFFQVMFLYHSMKETPSFGSELKLIRQAPFDMEVSKFDLTLYVSDNKGVIATTFEYASDLFDLTTIERFQKQFKNLLKAIIGNPNLAIAELSMFTEEEDHIFSTEQNDDSEHFHEFTGIHHIIENIALKNKEAIAVTFEESTLTYQELDEKANHLASIIHSKNKAENQIVGLCIDRSLDMIIALVAILKAGCAYLPIDPEYPLERIQYVLDDSNVATIVTKGNLINRFQNANHVIIDIDEVLKQVFDNTIKLPQAKRSDLAYIIYTSGSTGKPKGVPISHGNIINSTQGRLDFYDNNPSVFLLMSSISFDSSKAGIYWTLCTGGNLVISKKHLEQDISKFAHIIQTHQVSHTLLLPSLYQLVLKFVEPIKLESLKTVMVAGEACSTSLGSLHFKTLPEVQLYNEYGPTEGTVWCIAHQVTKEDLHKSIPIGRPVADSEIYILNKSLRRVPVGAKGEIYIGGKGLSGTYLNRPELTDLAYTTNPFGESSKDKIYRTGDYARYRKDGAIEFLGRADEQIKIRGFRVELDEIENVINDIPNINGAAVIVINKDINPQLVGYIKPLENYSKEKVLKYMGARLPKYMIPSIIIELEEFKKLPNGKIDKEHLKSIKQTLPVSEQKTKRVLTETEGKVHAVWSDVLKVADIDIDDNFFEIGGDSLMTIQVIALLRKAGMPVSPSQLFEYQTIYSIAKFVDDKSTTEDEWDYLVPLRKTGNKKPLFCIHAGGGHVFFYNGISEHLSKDIPVYALQPSGVYGGMEMHTSVADMARDYLERIRKIQPNGPYNILVYCFSVTVGNEMAVMLKKSGQEINLIVMDTMTAPAILNTPRRLKIRARTFANRLVTSPFTALKNALLVKYHIWQTKFRGRYDKDEESKELENMRINLMQLSKSYEWKPYAGKTSLILTKKDHSSLNNEIIRSWEEFSEERLNIIHIDGNHFDLFNDTKVKNTSAAIEKCIIL